MDAIQSLTGAAHLRIERPGLTDERCVWSDEPIPLDEYAVAFCSSAASRRILAWLRLGSVDAFCDALEQHDDDDAFSQAAHVTSDVADTGYCCTCGNPIDDGTTVVALTNPDINATATVHDACRRQLADALDGVWQHADELLTTAL